MPGPVSKTLFRRASFSTRGENNCHGFSQIIGERMEDRSNGSGRPDRHRSAGCLGWELAGHRNPLNRGSTRNSTSRKKSTAARAPTFPAATSPTEGSRTTWNFFPPASATRSAVAAARTDGWISERATGRRYWTTTHQKTSRRRVKSAPGPAARRARSRCP